MVTLPPRTDEDVLETIGSMPSTARSRQARIWDPAERSLARRLAAAPT